MLVAVITLTVLVVLLAAAFFWKVFMPNRSSDATMLLKTDMSQLAESMNQLKDGLQKQLTEQLGHSNKQMAAQLSESQKMVREVTRQLTNLERTNKSVGDIAGELKTLQ